MRGTKINKAAVLVEIKWRLSKRIDFHNLKNRRRKKCGHGRNNCDTTGYDLVMILQLVPTVKKDTAHQLIPQNVATVLCKHIAEKLRILKKDISAIIYTKGMYTSQPSFRHFRSVKIELVAHMS